MYVCACLCVCARARARAYLGREALEDSVGLLFGDRGAPEEAFDSLHSVDTLAPDRYKILNDVYAFIQRYGESG